MWNKDVYYVLQPQLDQSISLSRLLKRSSPSCRVVALVCSGEGRVPESEYDEVKSIQCYRDVPEGLRVIPTGAASTEALLEFRDVIIGDVVLKRSALAAYDKKRFLSLCETTGLPVPKTFYSIKDVPNEFYPLFYKQAHEQGGGKRGVAYAAEHVPEHDEGALIFQEYIDTPGTYGVGFLATDGELLVSFAHFERESYPEAGGSAVLIERVDDPVLIDMTAKVVRAMNYSGWGLAEFKYSEASKGYVFMEVNAKFWASCDLAFRSNPCFARFLFGLEIAAEKIDRQFYINRGLYRGLFFMIANLRALFGSDRVCYPGLVKALIYRLVPDALRTRLRAMRCRLRGG